MTPAPARHLPEGGGEAAPRHVAIIMDGNGRWAKKRFLPRVAGHRKGAEAVRKVVEAAPALGIQFLTLYAFSSENWKRPTKEVGDLMGLLQHYLLNELEALDNQNVCLKVIGDYSRLGGELARLIEQGMAQTAANDGLTLVLALNYGSRAEMLNAVRSIARDVRDNGLDPEAIDIAHIEARLDTHDMPAPDLIIRTSGEVRLSNFLLWQAAYAELLFVDTLWPDFDGAALAEAVHAYASRDRRYGAL